jgi:hypothetical protein
MAWPEDEEGRNSWMAAVLARGLAHSEELSIPDPIAEFGGLEVPTGEAFEANVGRLTEMSRGWARVADVLQTVIDLHNSGQSLAGGASISKAMALCADEKGTVSEGQMRREWGRFRNVAHLLAAGALLARDVPESDGTIFSAAWYAPDSLLAIAAGFQVFLLGWKPHGQSEPELSGSLWRLPEHYMPRHPWLPRRALSDRQRAVLSAYTARKKKHRQNLTYLSLTERPYRKRPTIFCTWLLAEEAKKCR